MLKQYILLFSVFILSHSLLSQTRVDSNFPFQSDPNKKYSLYIPSGYQVGTPNKVMLGFHPFNTSRWDAKSWCDTLIVFAETNQLILVCPDGGADGRVDDAIDTAFTTALLDSVGSWYSVNQDYIYVMGFSWGGLTTYKYGLSNAHELAGFMPIGAAINGTSPISSILPNANNKGFYVVHGSLDNPGTRYTPLVNALSANNAILNTKLMPGVGHTIDFPNRNQILTDAYLWLDSVRTQQLSSISVVENVLDAHVFPTLLDESISTVNIQLQNATEYGTVTVTDLNGKVHANTNFTGLETSVNIPEAKGTFFITISSGTKQHTERVVRY